MGVAIMIPLLFKLFGGIGLFLLGMVLLTDGLKAMAGDSLRQALVRFTGAPWKAFVSGTLVTAMVQSSSATTVTVIGFVSAGLLTFAQAVGVVMGASLGTTGTGWIVSVLGLKVSVGFYALPFIGAGAFLRLLARGRAKALGWALAGFGLIFVGIESLQEGMSGLSGRFPLSDLPAAGLWGHLLAMVVGVVLTVVMQSSSAAVATALTALHTASINFEQAASVVIGAAIGTTVTGALAAIGGSVSAKRTALAHVLFNLATGLIAVVALPFFLAGIGYAQVHWGLDPGPTSLAAFHSAFILCGVALFLPWIQTFSRLIERLLPDRGPTLTRHLDDTLLHAPSVALEASHRALRDSAAATVEVFRRALGDPALGSAGEEPGPEEINQALERIQAFVARIPPVRDDEPLAQARTAVLHAIDHLVRLADRMQAPAGVSRFLAHPRMREPSAMTLRVLKTAAQGIRGEAGEGWTLELVQAAEALAEMRHRSRPEILRETSEGEHDPHVALAVLDAMRWLDRIGYHTWRACHYLCGDRQDAHASRLAFQRN